MRVRAASRVQNLIVAIEQGAELQAKRGSYLFGVLLRLESTPLL